MSVEPSPTTPAYDPDLLAQHAQLLRASVINPEVAAARGYRSARTKAELRRLGFGNAQSRVPALLIPTWDVRGEIALYQLRPDQPRIVDGKAVKYETPAGTRMVLDIPPGARTWLADPTRPLFITEGVRKADAAVSAGLCCIAILGVWSWRGRNEKGGTTALPDWECVALNDREVYIVFDSDVMQKREVSAALARLKAFLESRGAKVALIYLPAGPGGAKVGLDDYLAAGNSAQKLLQLASTELRETRSDEDSFSIGSSSYSIQSGRFCVLRETRDGSFAVPLCNFTARVVEEIELDDGQDTSRAFLIEGALDSHQHLPAVRVPVERFGGMSWVTGSWGLRAVVRAGLATKDQLREAIQLFSSEARRRQVFTHTGWRKLHDRWYYLTANGAVGVDSFEVELGSELTRYSLPRSPEDPLSAMKESLRLLEVADLRVTAPLWAGVFRAPLASAHPLDFSIWVEGPTGSMKSTLAALFLSHWGSFERTALPGAWSSTANALERRAFVLKDVMFVVDDYAPSGLDRREYELKAARLLRAQGNLAGRGRLRSDLTERPGYPPRGLIVGTGEQRPSGPSVVLRTFLVELDRRDVDTTLLTAAQQAAARLPHAMAGYVAWLVPQMDSMPDTLGDLFRSTRARAAGQSTHLRIPEAVANLWLGIDLGLAYAEEIGACDASQARDLRTGCWTALVERASAQGRLVEEEKPARRFLEVLSTLLDQQRALLLPKENPGEGIRPEIPLLGWQDQDFLYLLPEAAFQAVSRFTREAGESFPVRESRLRKDLVVEGIAKPDPGRATASARVGGRVRRVLRLSRVAVAAVLGEEEPGMLPPVTAVTGSGE